MTRLEVQELVEAEHGYTQLNTRTWMLDEQPVREVLQISTGAYAIVDVYDYTNYVLLDWSPAS